jgi:branched-chain amino acid transport system substrate-binding protein
MRASIRATAGTRPATTGHRSRCGRRWAGGLAALSLGVLPVMLAACGVQGSSSNSSSSGGNSSKSGSTYTIHALLSVTGSAAFLGGSEKAALEAMQKQVNSTGGIDGHKVNFAISDNQSVASTSVSLASPLINQVPMMIVGALTTVDRPVDNLATSNGPVIYDLSPGDHPAKGGFVYSASNSTTSQTKAFVNFAKTKGWSRVAAITSTDTSGQDGWTNIQKAIAGSGGAVSVASHQTFDPKSVSVTTQLSQIKAANPQALMIWTTGTPLATVLKGMQQLGMGSMPTMTTNGNASAKQMQQLSNVLPAKLYFPGAPFQIGPQNLTGEEKTAVQTFDSAMKAQGVPVASEGNALAWDPALLLVSALKKLGVNATAAQVNHYIASQTSFPGINGSYNFVNDPSPDNRGLGISSIYITSWNKSAGNWAAESGPAGQGAPPSGS